MDGRQSFVGQQRNEFDEVELQQSEFDVRQLELFNFGIRPATDFARRALFAVGGNDFLDTGIDNAFGAVQREVFGLAPIAIYYFVNVFDKNFYVWSDYIFAIAWCVAVFWFTFRSPLYWWLGGLKGYKLTAQTAYGIRYARTHNL